MIIYTRPQLFHSLLSDRPCAEYVFSCLTTTYWIPGMESELYRQVQKSTTFKAAPAPMDPNCSDPEGLGV